MAWREELIVGTLYAQDGVNIGAYPGTAISATELGYLDGVTAGTVTASKALVVDANKDLATLRHLTISGNLITGSTTLTEAELGVLDGVTVGTCADSKAATFDANGKMDFAGMHGGTAAANALLMGGGTSGDPMTTATASKVFMEFRTESTATSGDSRCLYMRHAISGAGGGGEALRAFSKVNGVAASTVRGAHISIDFAASGSVTGFGAGLDAQVMYADETNASTLTALNLELYAGGSSTDVSGLNSFIRCVFSGDQGGIDNFDDDAVLFSLVGLTAGGGQLFDSTINTAGAQIDHTLKIDIAGTSYYIPLMDNADGS